MKNKTVNGIPVIDFSHCKSGEEELRLIIDSPQTFIMEGETEIEREMSKPEESFSVGDIVKVNPKLLEYLGIKDDESTMIVYGVTKNLYCDGYTYKLLKKNEECMFTGNELVMVKKGGALPKELK